MRPRPPSIVLVWTLALLGGCGTSDSKQVCQTLFTQPVPLCASGAREFNLTQESKRYEYPDVENADGTITRVIWVQEGQATALAEMLKGHPAFQAVRSTTRSSFFKEPLSPSAKELLVVPSNEGMMLTGSRENVTAATEIINYVLTSIPQIEIEARIVEVREDDDFALGTDLFVLGKDHPFDPMNPSGPLSPTQGFFDRARTNFGIPGQTGRPPVLLELGTITDGLQLDLMISAMKMLTKADVLSAPRIAVLNGFKAEFLAGQDVPILKQNVIGTTVTITTEFRQVGVRLIVVPSLVSRDIVRMSVKTKVENVIGTTPLVTGTTTSATPIISVREATTTVDVRDGSAVVIGGLFTTSKVESRDRVPVLGEIPMLGVLFGSTRIEDAHTNLLFFIRPRLISPGGQAGAVIVPPASDLAPCSTCPPAPCPPAPCPPR